MQKPTSTNGRRIAAAMFLGAASTAMVAGTAHADGVTDATFHKTGAGGAVHMQGDGPDGSNAVLIDLHVQGSDSDLWTYCIQKTVELNTSETYNEHAWSDESGRTGIDQQHLEAIKWILNNSYPQLSLGQLAQASNVAGLTDDEAVEGTQAAIWDMSDASGKTTLDTTAEKDTKVAALYAYLVNAASHNMTGTAPKASLSFGPPSTAKPQAGAKVAFTLLSNTADSPITVTLNDAAHTGAKLVDATGKALTAHTTFKKGDVVYVQLPTAVPAGTVSLNASATVSGIEAGRVFLSADGKPSQNLILAQAQSTPVSASTTISWTAATPTTPTTTPSSSPSTAPSSHPSTSPSTTPSTPSTTPSTTTSSPTGGLAHTGAGDTVPLAGGALALVAAGGGMTVYTRRVRRQGSHL